MAKDLLSTFLPTAEVFPSRPLTLQIGATFGPFYVNLFSSRPNLVGTYAADSTTDILTLASHGLFNGDMVQFQPRTATSKITDGLTTGELYFVANANDNQLQVTLIPGFLTSSVFSVVDIKNNDAGKIYKCGTPYDLTDHKVWAWVKHLRTDADNDLILDLVPTITGASLGFGYDWQITFSKTKDETFNLSPGVNVWSLLLQFPDGTRSLLVDNSRFTISLPTTHPEPGAS